MENIDNRLKEYQKFNAIVRERVSRIGAEKGSTIRSAQAVVERLFEATKGDASLVTDDDIARNFADIDALP